MSNASVSYLLYQPVNAFRDETFVFFGVEGWLGTIMLRQPRFVSLHLNLSNTRTADSLRAVLFVQRSCNGSTRDRKSATDSKQLK